MLTIRTILITTAFAYIGIFLVPPMVRAELYTVDRIISGDVIRLSNGEKVRLIGVDSPENQRNTKARKDSRETGQDIETIVKAGRAAADWLEEYFEGKKVFLRYDTQEKDKRGLTLAYVFAYDDIHLLGGDLSRQLVKDFKKEWNDPLTQGNFVFVNGTIVKAGYAQPAPASPNLKYADAFEDLYQKAKENRKGIWDLDLAEGSCRGEGENVTNCIWCVTECCDGLDPMFDLMSGGKCMESPAVGATGVCSDCGNKVCEENYNEDDCNCYKDCK